jgi:epsilon-lactone hydrolase
MDCRGVQALPNIGEFFGIASTNEGEVVRTSAALKKGITVGLMVLLITIMNTRGVSAEENATQHLMAHDVGMIRVPAFDLPVSNLLATEAQIVLQQQAKQLETAKVCPYNPYRDVRAWRKCTAEKVFPEIIRQHKRRYSVQIQSVRIAGVYTEIVTPADGIAPENRERVLINLHGSGFVGGARQVGQMESIPIAAVGKIKVVTVDYRLAPEHTFPAATEDVVAVYRRLLREYRSESIGLYGCSAGGLLTAQTIVWLQKEGLPLPAAIGMFCAGGSYWAAGDSGHFGAALSGASSPAPQEHPYFKDADVKDPLVFPILSAHMMAKFPPSLLITATRDVALSSVAYTHSRLVELGVEADLHVWEGLGHAFFFDPELPQSREVYKVTVKFFDKHLRKH